jgi:POT family proton-dependent oligopeptide transporter
MLGRLIILYVFVAVFWSLYDQTSSAWVLQAEKMDLNLLGYTLQASQVQSINPLLVLLFIPIFSYVIYPVAEKFVKCTPLRKISAGLFMAVIGFAISVYVEQHIAEKPTVWWQVLAFAFMTAAEILISVTCLEYSYTQAPTRLKSLVMSIYLGSIAAGNLFTALVNKFIQNSDHTSKLPGASYYIFFTGLMLATAILFIFFTPLMKSKTANPDAQAPATP